MYEYICMYVCFVNTHIGQRAIDSTATWCVIQVTVLCMIATYCVLCIATINRIAEAVYLAGLSLQLRCELRFCAQICNKRPLDERKKK